MKLQAKEARIIVDGVEKMIPVEEVKVGDLLLIKPGEKIPVDGIVVKGDTYVDESMLTGESIPIYKTVDDEVIGATLNKNGTIEMRAVKVGKDTALANIIQAVEEAQGSKAPIQRLADKISGIFVPIVVVIASVTFLIGYSSLVRTILSLLWSQQSRCSSSPVLVRWVWRRRHRSWSEQEKPLKTAFYLKAANI